MGQVVKNWGAMYWTILVSHWNSFNFTDEAMVFFFCYQGIEWTAIDYFNNAIICDLVEKVSGDNKWVNSLFVVFTEGNLAALIFVSPVLFFQCILI